MAKPLTPSQRAQRSVAAKASAAKRKKTKRPYKPDGSLPVTGKGPASDRKRGSSEMPISRGINSGKLPSRVPHPLGAGKALDGATQTRMQAGNKYGTSATRAARRATSKAQGGRNDASVTRMENETMHAATIKGADKAYARAHSPKGRAKRFKAIIKSGESIHSAVARGAHDPRPKRKKK